MTTFEKIRLAFVPAKVRSLYVLVVLERTMAQQHPVRTPGSVLYVEGRTASYRFVADAIERRYPVLKSLPLGLGCRS